MSKLNKAEKFEMMWMVLNDEVKEMEKLIIKLNKKVEYFKSIKKRINK